MKSLPLLSSPIYYLENEYYIMLENRLLIMNDQFKTLHKIGNIFRAYNYGIKFRNYVLFGNIDTFYLYDLNNRKITFIYKSKGLSLGDSYKINDNMFVTSCLSLSGQSFQIFEIQDGNISAKDKIDYFDSQFNPFVRSFDHTDLIGFTSSTLRFLSVPDSVLAPTRIISLDSDTKTFHLEKEIETGIDIYAYLDKDHLATYSGNKILNISTLEVITPKIPDRYFYPGCELISNYLITRSSDELCFINIHTGENRSLLLPRVLDYKIVNDKIFVTSDKMYIYELKDYAPTIDIEVI